MSVNNCQYAKRISAQHPILRETVARGALVINWGQHQYVMQFQIEIILETQCGGSQGSMSEIFELQVNEIKITGTLHFAGCLLCNVDVNIIAEKIYNGRLK